MKPKPCPFCGVTPIVRLERGMFVIGCFNPECQMLIMTPRRASEKKAVEDWNTRKEGK